MQSKTLHSYSEVASLSAVKLKDLCVKFKVDISLPKKATHVYLCHTLGISTTGNNSSCTPARKHRTFDNLTSKQREEIKKLTPRVLYNLPPSEWSGELATFQILRTYLLSGTY